jgi:hypothetical protein
MQKLSNNLHQMAIQSEKGGFDISNGFCPINVPQSNNSGMFSPTFEGAQKSGEHHRMKKFRFQLFHQWLIQNFKPCRVADIGGGKGLLTYLLRKSKWEATVIDPVYQPLPQKYKDIALNRRINILPDDKIPRINEEFEPNLAKHFDILVGMHAHACNVKIINAAVEFNRAFVLLPCCIIDEPIHPVQDVHWLECLADYAIQKGFTIRPFRLNFSGQSIGFYSIHHEL